jgi:hypothetical protein
VTENVNLKSCALRGVCRNMYSKRGEKDARYKEGRGGVVDKEERLLRAGLREPTCMSGSVSAR